MSNTSEISACTIAVDVVRQLQTSGYIGVFVGGAVRDVTPKDYDVATNATPDQIKQVFADDTCLLVGEQFGIIIVVREGVQVEVATLRNDGQYGDGRRPDSVKFVTDTNIETALRADAARRDLTINAMFKDPISGNIYDFFGGQDDLKNRIIRTVSKASERFAEDRLRMLRVVRFAAKLKFTVDPALKAAIKKQARELKPGKTVSWERIASELEKILTSDAPVIGINLLWETGLMREILPEMLPLAGLRGLQDPLWHPELWAINHTKMVVGVSVTREGIKEKLAEFTNNGLITKDIEEWIETSLTSFAFRLSLLLHDVAKPKTQKFYLVRRTPGVKSWLRFLPFRIKISNHKHAEIGAVMAEQICKRLKLSNEVTKRVKEIVRMHMHMHDYKDQPMSRRKMVQLMQREEIFDLILMQHCDSFGTGRTREQREDNSLLSFYLKLMVEMRNDPVASRRTGAKALITGEHIIAQGLKPGPVFKYILYAALDAQHDGLFTDEAGAVTWLKEHLEELQASYATAENC